MHGPPADDLTALLDALAEDPTRWEYFAAARALDAAAPDRPRIGEALDPALEPVDLEHHPSLDFPRTTVAGWRDAKPGRRPALRSQHLGLTGPMGPLPTHLTEIAIFERRRRGPTPFADFLDLLSARALQNFHRAWADGDPCANADRPADDRFAGHLGAVGGVAALDFLDPRTRRPAAEADRFDDWRRLPYAGHLASLRNPSAIASLLSHLLGRPVAVTEAVGRWRPIPEDQRSRLGRAHAALGQGATLGRRFWAVEFDVGLSIKAKSMDDLADLLPGGRAHRLLAEAARAALPHHIEWRARVAIGEQAIAPARLAKRDGTGAKLGWTSWIAPRGRVRPRHDLSIRDASRHASSESSGGAPETAEQGEWA